MKLTATLLALVIALAACGSDETPPESSGDCDGDIGFDADGDLVDSCGRLLIEDGDLVANDPAPVPVGTIRVDLRANGGGTVTIRTPDGTVQHDSDRYVERFEVPADSSWFPYISVQNDDDRGEASCSITIENVEVSANTSTAAYGIATCSL